MTGQSTTKSPPISNWPRSRQHKRRLALLISTPIARRRPAHSDPKVLGNIKDRTGITTVKDTNIVKITVTDANARFAADFANALAESYNELLGSIARNSKTVQKEFIESQIPLNEKELQGAADALGAFREESNIISSDRAGCCRKIILPTASRAVGAAIERIGGYYDQLRSALTNGSQVPSYSELGVDAGETPDGIVGRSTVNGFCTRPSKTAKTASPRQYILDSSVHKLPGLAQPHFLCLLR